MPIKRFQLGSGLALAADPTAIPNDALVEARGCDFSLAGCVGSARGRSLVYALGSAIYGHLEGAYGGTRYRFTKAGTALYENGVSIGALTGTGLLSGVSYNDRVYMGDGTTLRCWDGTTLRAVGLDPPGWIELGANPITTEVGTTVTVAVPTGHGIVAGDKVEIRQASAVGGLSVHYINAAVTVLASAATSFTFTAGAAATSVATGGGSYVVVLAGPIVTATAGTSAFETGTYKYAYTFWNGVAESNFSALVSVSLDATHYAALTGIKAGPTGTTARRIYRTDINGANLFFIHELSDNTTTIHDDYDKLPVGAATTAVPGDAVTTNLSALPENSDVETSQRVGAGGLSVATQRWGVHRTASSGRREAPEVQLTNLGYLADWLDHDPPPDDLEQLFMVDEQLFGKSGNGIRFSLTGQPEHFPIYNEIIPGLRTSGLLRSALPLGRDVIAYTDEGIHRITKIGMSFEDSRMEAVESPVGLVGKYAVAALDGVVGHVFLARDGLYYFDGSAVTPVSSGIETMFTDDTHEDYVNPDFVSTVRIVASRKLMFMSYGVTAANDRLLVADIRNPTEPKFFVVEWALTTLVREPASGAIIAGDTDGNLWQLDQGWNDNDAAIEWLAKTKRYAVVDPVLPVAVSQLYLDADFAGASTTVTVTAYGSAGSKSFEFTVATDGRQRVKKRLPPWMHGETFDVEVCSSSRLRRQWFNVGFQVGDDEAEDD